MLSHNLSRFITGFHNENMSSHHVFPDLSSSALLWLLKMLQLITSSSTSNTFTGFTLNRLVRSVDLLE